MTDRMQQIRAQLDATFAPVECQLLDESERHKGHAGAASGGGHYRLYLVSAAFEGKSRVLRHRLVYDCLRDMMRQDVHAIAITAVAPSEVQPAN